MSDFGLESILFAKSTHSQIFAKLVLLAKPFATDGISYRTVFPRNFSVLTF